MKSVARVLFATLCISCSLLAGQEQAFFLATVQGATAVKIEKVAGREPNGAIAWKVLLQSNDPMKIKEVVAAIEMVDANPGKTSNGEEVWQGSGLTFGIPDCTIVFTNGNRNLLEYWLEASPTSITAAGPRAKYGPDMVIALPLTAKSSVSLQHLISSLERMPIQSTTPKPASGAQPADPQPPTQQGSPPRK